jgi:hypothetical protein
MIPGDETILEDVLRLLVERDPNADRDELKSKLDQPLDRIYDINSQIGIGIASALRELYRLPGLPPTKLKNRNFYISIGGLLDLIKEMAVGS